MRPHTPETSGEDAADLGLAFDGGHALWRERIGEAFA